jgi:hypothetical protein
MADKKISELTAAGALAGTEDVPIVQGGETVRTTVQDIADLFDASAYQPLDGDLTAIAALTTTAAGRSTLTIADPGVDRIVAWDDTAGAMAAIALADLTDEASPATGDYLLIYGAEGDLRKTNWSELPGGSASPGGSDTQVQYNNSSAFGGAANFTISSGNPNVTSGNAYLYNSVNAIRAVTADNNWFIGASGNLTLTGTNNLAMGPGAAANITSGQYNVAIGQNALTSASSASDNMAVGAASLISCSTGFGNVGVGRSSLLSLTDGEINVAIGGQSLFNLTTGDGNIGVGFQAGYDATEGSNNTLIGRLAGENITTSGSNSCFGAYAGSAITSGGGNVSIGLQSDVATATADWQLSIQNIIYGTDNSGTGSTISTGKIGIGVKAPAVKLDVDGPIMTKGYTVAGLPAAGASIKGARAYVTDATAPTFLATLTGGGTVICPVFCDGTNWVSA